MALKGSAVIELTNVKTGEVERYEEHNLVTKALEYLHTPIGQLKSPCDCTILGEPVYNSLLGGILLLDSALEEDDAIVTLPTDVNVVGCACYGQTNTTTSPKRGSYNEAESYLTTSSAERSMKFVYDFATNQANGNINCISLSNWKSGWNGFGGNDACDDNIPSSGGRYGCYLGYAASTRYWLSNTTSAIAKLLLIDPEEDVFYHVSSLTTTSVTIAKRRANIHQKSVFTDMYSSHDLVESIQIALPTSLTGTNTYLCSYDTRNDVAYIMVSPTASSVAAGGTFHVIEVDLNARTAAVYTRTNPLSTAMSFVGYYVTCFDGNLYYATSGNTYVRKIPLDGSAYKSIYLGGEYFYNASNCYYFSFVNERLYVPVSPNKSNSNTDVGVINPDTNEFDITGDVYGPSDLYSGIGKCVPIRGNPLLFYYYSSSSYSHSTSTGYGRIWMDTHYLATINNLSRTIEKTSDKTMKITYTIQEV
ncbi:MAG: hypothetical protein IJA67_03445 [Oscillospiraceae bacterium]|nr:hypothetical protein [Oscillospiraceae bacterium]